MNEYYVYIYLDPRKSGKFIYDKYSFNNEPFYVGKGKKSRYLRHLKTNEWNKLKINKISKIKASGYNPIISKIESDLSNAEAMDLEIKLIKLIGKIKDKNGPLTNISDGGESYTGYKHNEDFIGKLNKPVIKYDLDGNKIEEYKSVKEAGEKNNINPQTISSICNNSIKIWKNKFIFLNKNREFKKRQRFKKEYPVIRIDYLGNTTEYCSLYKAAIDNDVLVSKINQVCIGNKFQYDGYYWKYKSHLKCDIFEKKYKSNFYKYIEISNNKIIDSEDNIQYDNILHLILKKKIKVNDIFNSLTKNKRYKFYEY